MGINSIKTIGKNLVDNAVSSAKKTVLDKAGFNNDSSEVLDIVPTGITLSDAEIKKLLDDLKGVAPIIHDASTEIVESLFQSNYNKIIDKIENYSYSTLTEDWISEKSRELWASDIDIFDYCDDFLQMDTIMYYLKNVDDCSVYDDYTLEQKVAVAKQVMLFDFAHGYDILHSTPMLMEGKVDTGFCISSDNINHYEYDGKYLQYYNENGIEFISPLAIIGADENGNACKDKEFSRTETFDYTIAVSKYYAEIMRNSEKYTDEFNDTVNKHLKRVFMAQFDTDDKEALNSTEDGKGRWVAYASENEVGIFRSVDSNMTIDIGATDSSRCGFEYMVDSYTHELGHVFANASGWHLSGRDDMDLCKEWKEVYKQLEPYTTEEGGNLLRPYAASNSQEAFAECIAEYFGGNSSKYYNPNDLKVIEVTVNGKVRNLYDVMEYILHHEY